ncbi:integrase [Luteimonas composti]|uniref:Integrase n=1 Tax=Luteimonas composti TaxID=398257 RepID=A0ABT6MSB1_9GAMM|nr:integrase [Luteimonas composti]MDH7453541.1 integrase [Luteimonas composti]
MPPAGRPRKVPANLPPHIDYARVPKGVYWDASGTGRWFVFELGDSGRKVRKTIAGRDARLSELHGFVEDKAGTGTVDWLAAAYHASPKFKALAKTTRADYEYSRDVMLAQSTSSGGRVGLLQADRLRTHHLQRLVDRIAAEGTPTKAAKVLRYARLLFSWGLRRGLVSQNPGKGLEAPEERRRQRLPAQQAYLAMLSYAVDAAARTARTKGSHAPYLPLVMELGYLCRLRGIETLNLTEAQETPDGIRTNRRKGSRDNVVAWSPRLRAVWTSALTYRRDIIARTTRLHPLRAEDRYLILAENGEPLTRSGLDSAWQRLVRAAIEEGIIDASDRFSLHDLKRKGGTDTPGTRAEKQDALGLTEQMMKVYDKSVPTVKPSA